MSAVFWVTAGSVSVLSVANLSLAAVLTLVAFLLAGLAAWLTLRFIPNNAVGVVEKLWSQQGSVPEGRIVATGKEAGFQCDLLRGGVHFGFWRWQYRVHKTPLVTIPQGKIGYVYARDGKPLSPSQTLGPHIPCNNFQDARAFLEGTRSRASAASEAGNWRFCAKACTRSTRPCSW